MHNDDTHPDEHRDRRGDDARDPAAGGLYLYGVTRSRNWRSPGQPDGERLIKVRYRDLDALVRAVPFRVPELDEASLAQHQRLIEATFRRSTVLPAPFGMVFRGRRAIIRFLEDQYIILDEGLAFLDGLWELRLHMAGEDDEDHSLTDLATHLYSELRRFARAAIPLRAAEGQLLSAAFLVERGTWIEFVERTDDLNASHPDLSFDLTGPWPPYDFVRIRT